MLVFKKTSDLKSSVINQSAVDELKTTEEIGIVPNEEELVNKEIFSINQLKSKVNTR